MKTKNRDVGTDAQVGTARAVTLEVPAHERDTRRAIFVPAESSGATYIEIFRDRGCATLLAASARRADAKPVTVPDIKGKNRATAVSHFTWRGDELTFRVDPDDADRVYVKFNDKDLEYDVDRSGRQDPVIYDVGEQLDGIREVRVDRGQASVTAPGDSHAYATVFQDAACTKPLGRSKTRKESASRD